MLPIRAQAVTGGLGPAGFSAGKRDVLQDRHSFSNPIWRGSPSFSKPAVVSCRLWGQVSVLILSFKVEYVLAFTYIHSFTHSLPNTDLAYLKN